MQSVERVAITGLGILVPGATGIDAFREMIQAGRSAIAPVERFDTAHFAAHAAGLVVDFKPKDFIPVMKMRRMNALSRLGVAAARMAIDDRPLAGRYGRGEVGVAEGTCFGPVQTSLDYMEEYVAKGPALAPPQLFAESVANAPGSHIAIEHGFEGFNLTFTQRESSAMAALTYAASQVAKGTVRAALAGGVEEMNEMTFSVLDRMRALAHRNGLADEACRPFDRRRNGIVAGEGSVAFILEREPDDHLPYAWVAGFAVARDVTATISDWGEDASAVERAMRRAIEDAGIRLSDIDAVWASANSSLRGDRLEYRAIQNLFGESIPPVVATKGLWGEYAAAGGAQIASAVIALRDQLLPASIGFAEGEAEMRFAPTRIATTAKLEHILVNSISAGGGIISIVLSRSAT